MLAPSLALGPLTVNLYTLLIALAALGAVGWAWLRARDDRVVPTALGIAAAALAFGRAGTVALNWVYFREHPTEIFSLAGLSEHAAIIGALLAAGALAWMWARRRSAIAPAMVAGLPIALVLLVVAASIGCIPNGCAYGREVFWQTDGEFSLAWLLRADWPDAILVQAPRWPTQLVLAAGVGVMWGVGAWVAGRRRKATSRDDPLRPAAWALLAFATVDFLVQFLRGDPAPTVGGLRIYQAFDVGLAAVAVALLIAAHRRSNPEQAAERPGGIV